ncbi:Alpha/beta hydrolase fold protein [Pseudomonas sp. CFII68]|nr:Alpha/beta hydrolase fold protein [Pseudomonas sp. CFII68]
MSGKPSLAHTHVSLCIYEHRLIDGGVGHNLPQEAPQAFAQAVIDADHLQ